MTILNIFANQSGQIPLSELDTNFATPITIGTTQIALGQTATTLTGVTLSGANLGTPTGNLANCVFPTLNQNTTGTASNVTGIVAVGNGGTGLTSLTAGYIPYGNGTGALNSSAGLFFDGTNLGIGTSSPAAKLDVQGGRSYFASNSDSFAAYLRYNNSTAGVFLGSPSANAFQISNSGGGAYLNIDSSGNVGIGLVPSAAAGGLLQLGNTAQYGFQGPTGYLNANIYFGSGAFRYAITGAASSYQQNSGQHIWSYAASGTAGAAVSLSESMRIDSSGNVGIGTSSPAAKLDVQGGRSYFASNSDSFAAYLRYNNSTAGVFLGSPSANAFQISNSGGGAYLNIDSSGNVGIGLVPSAAAGGLLQLGNTAQYGFQGPTGYLNANIYFGSGAFRYAITGAASSYQQNSGQHIWSYAASGTAGAAVSLSESMRIDSSGNVGIGTSSIGGKFTVDSSNIMPAASGAMNTGVIFQAGGASQALNLGSSTTNNISWINAAYSNNSGVASNLAFMTGASERMRIDSSGNVGIGTSSPNASAILDAQSTTKGVRFPNMTTTQKNAVATPAAGLVVFDTTLSKLCVYSGAAWQTITSI